MTDAAKGALSVAPHGHTIEMCPEHKELHCTRCCGARPVSNVATEEPFCGRNCAKGGVVCLTPLQNFLAWLLPIILISLVAIVFYVWGRAQGRLEITQEVCRKPISQYYEVCE